VRAVSVIAIYGIYEFNLFFKLNISPISTHPCTVIHTICFQQTGQYIVLMLPHVLAANHSHFQGFTVLNIYSVYYANCHLEIVNCIHVVSLQN